MAVQLHAAQREGNALAVGGDADLAGHLELGGELALEHADVEAGLGVAAKRRPGGNGRRGGHHRGGRGKPCGLGVDWRQQVQLPRARRRRAGGLARLGGGQAQLHAGPVLAAALRDLGMAFQPHLAGGGVEVGAVDRFPAGLLRQPVAQAQFGVAGGGQAHGHRADLRIGLRQPVSLSRQRRQLAGQLIFAALQRQQLLQGVEPAAAQRVGGGRDAACAALVVAAADLLQITQRQLVRGGFGVDCGDLVFQLADAQVERRFGAIGRGGALHRLHADLAEIDAGLGRELQRIGIEARGQTRQPQQLLTGLDRHPALHRRAAGIDQHLLDAAGLRRGQTGCPHDQQHQHGLFFHRSLPGLAGEHNMRPQPNFVA